jgi:hypothetical protein
MALALFAFTVTSGMTIPASVNESQPGTNVTDTGDEISGTMEESLVDSSTSNNELIDDFPNGSEPGDVVEDYECGMSEKFPDKVVQWCEQITKYSHKNDLDPDLVAALILQESGGNPTAYSNSGAVGLMQVMPRDGLAASFSCVNGPCFSNRPSINQLEDPKFNIQYGTNMLAGLIKKHGDVREALKAYGPMNVGYYYADIVLGLYRRYKD